MEIVPVSLLNLSKSPVATTASSPLCPVNVYHHVVGGGHTDDFPSEQQFGGTLWPTDLLWVPELSSRHLLSILLDRVRSSCKTRLCYLCYLATQNLSIENITTVSLPGMSVLGPGLGLSLCSCLCDGLWAQLACVSVTESGLWWWLGLLTKISCMSDVMTAMFTS